MPSTYTDILRLELQADGENDGTWGQILNDNVIALVEDAIAGTADVSTTGGTTALSTNDGAEDQARKRAINVTGSLASDAIIEVPAQTKPYRVINGTSGSFTVEVLVSGQSAGNGVVVPQGARQEVWCDGTNVEPTSLPLDDSGIAQNFASTGIDDNASSTAITINSSNQVGIGRSSSLQGVLHLQASGTTAAQYITADTDQAAALLFGDTDDVSRGWLQYNNTNDTLQIGTNNTADWITIESDGAITGPNNWTISNGQGEAILFSNASNAITIEAGGAEFLRAEATKGVTIGTAGSAPTSSGPYGVKLDTNGAFTAFRDIGSGNYPHELGGNSGRLRIEGNGDAENTNGTYGTISDPRLKQDVTLAHSQWDDVRDLGQRFVNYRLIESVEKLGDDAPTLLSVLADDDFATRFPGLTNKNADGYRSFKQSVAAMKTIIAVSELIQRVEAMEAKLS
jgi:hypothetical protein